MRMTEQRKYIMDEVSKSRSHPTASELYQRVRRHLPRISLGTVYRNLAILVSHGYIRKLEVGSGESRYDGDLSDHYHLRCLECGQIEDVFHVDVLDLEAIRSRQRDFIIQGYSLDIFGICSSCRGCTSSGKRR